MSYIEKKYLNKINEIFEKELPQWEDYLLELLNKRSIAVADNIAKVCADFNKNINLILKKYYPEIKDIDDKLNIKSILKFYFDLIDYLTDFIRNVENFHKISNEYYETIIKFVEQKDFLISGKYRDICRLELTCFYDKETRENLERIIAEKFEIRERQFFAMGSLEEEIKKIGKYAGASRISIFSVEKRNRDKHYVIDNPNTYINYTIISGEENKLKKIGKEIRTFLISKGYKAEFLNVEFSDINTEREGLSGTIITDAKLLTDK